MFSSIVSAGDDILATQYNNLRKDRIQIGSMVWFGANTAPTTFLVCDGSAVSRTVYASLFAEISTTFGVGDGSTTFNLPNVQDQYIIGKSGTKALGSTGGANSVILVTANLPAHTHTISSDGSHTHFIWTHTAGSGDTHWNAAGDGSTTPDTIESASNTAEDHGGSVNNTGQASPTALDITPRFVALKLIIQLGITADVASQDDFLASQINNLSTEAVPTGGVVMHGETSAPTGYLLADGSAVSRVTYSELFDIIGTTFGVGDGSTTFNLPDLEDQFIVGASGTKAVGLTGGATTMVTNNLPQHNHLISTTASHTHTFPMTGGSGSLLARLDDNSALFPNVEQSSGAHDHTGVTGSIGSASAMEFNPAYQAIVYVIKY